MCNKAFQWSKGIKTFIYLKLRFLKISSLTSPLTHSAFSDQVFWRWLNLSQFLPPAFASMCVAYRTRCRFQCQSNYVANETIKLPGRSIKRAHPFRQSVSQSGSWAFIQSVIHWSNQTRCVKLARCDEKSIEIFILRHRTAKPATTTA